ncbi:sensor histidine kinase [Marinobacterium lutimaris]|uniref:histidine kinase n=1 Tax=Marinobacterium lutimaris TaxID=568106 RepID=A0A1H5YSU2_9GAMM|nr:cache domain-containing protein [Marinobacterium lutimaris]SEG26557.1 two-component system, NtrC family, sensor kinase [Marinobacterium lutimaris]
MTTAVTTALIKRCWQRLTGNLRYRLLALTLFPLLLVLPGVVLLAYLWSNEVGYRQLLMKANTDLAVAHEAFFATRDRYLVRLSLAAAGDRFHHALLNSSADGGDRNNTDTPLLLEQLRSATGFDYVRLLDPRGCSLTQPGDCSYPDSPLIQQAKMQGPVSGVEVFSAAELSALSAELATRARIPLVATQRATQSERSVEDRAMMLHFVYPLRDNSGNVAALLTAGLLMNANLGFVDHISNTVYGPGSLPADGIGTVTLFLDDVRISTNVQHPEAPRQRALGTRVSAQVRHQVLEEGERWLDRAFVVSDWYISAYEPVIDVNGHRIGMLYAGFLEAPFLESFYHWLELLLWLFALVLLLCTFIAIAGARSISRPFEIMTAVVDRIRGGERQRIPPLNTTDEVRVLAEHFNAMLAQLDQQHDAIQQAAVQLEEKVQERTLELKQHIAMLNETREQLIEKGKLAALGELTAGIAHEVNNPTAVILGYMDLLLDELGEQATPEIRRDAELIIEQVGRIRTIINDLLKLARPSSPRTHLEAIDINDLVLNTRTLVQHELKRRGINLRLELRASHRARADASQLQQVLINLVMNGANAISGSGEIRVRSRNLGDGGVSLSIHDNGCGIPTDQLARIFDPFYSRGKQGTGLGLSISQRLLEQADASIKVRSRQGLGTLFVIHLKPGSRSEYCTQGHFDPVSEFIGS